MRWNQSSIALRRRSSGTRLPASSRPSAMGRVSSKTASLVKLRMAKLSSCAMGHGWAAPAKSMRSIVRRRRNIKDRVLGPGCQVRGSRFEVRGSRFEEKLVVGGVVDVVDDEYVDGTAGAFELQTQLLLDGGGEGGVAVGVGGLVGVLEGEVVAVAREFGLSRETVRKMLQSAV